MSGRPLCRAACETRRQHELFRQYVQHNTCPSDRLCLPNQAAVFLPYQFRYGFV